MFLICLVAFLATIGFYRRAQQIGIHPGKAASLPFLVAGLMSAVMVVGAAGIGIVLDTMQASHDVKVWTGRILDGCLILTYLAYIKRNWDILTRRSAEDSTRAAEAGEAEPFLPE